MIELEDVCKVYPGGLVAVDHVTLRIEKGEMIAVIGPSGCGKTTTLKMINRLIDPSSGTIRVGGEDISRVDPVQLRRRIGYTIQQVGLFPHMTVAENIAFVLRITGRLREEQRRRAEELIQLVGMPESVLGRYPAELSGGQQQRVGVARALAADPEVVLMDEPFGALDPLTREQLQDELIRLHAQLSKTIVFVTHDIQEAFRLGGRVALMRAGRLVQLGRPADFIERPVDDFVANFVGLRGFLNYLAAVPVRDVMVTDFPRARIGTVAGDVDALLGGWDAAVVVSGDGVLAGVVRRENLAPGCIIDGPVVAPLHRGVDAFAPVGQALEEMLVRGLTWLPVEENGRLVGMITFRSCFKLFGARGIRPRS